MEAFTNPLNKASLTIPSQWSEHASQKLLNIAATLRRSYLRCHVTSPHTEQHVNTNTSPHTEQSNVSLPAITDVICQHRNIKPGWSPEHIITKQPFILQTPIHTFTYHTESYRPHTDRRHGYTSSWHSGADTVVWGVCGDSATHRRPGGEIQSGSYHWHDRWDTTGTWQSYRTVQHHQGQAEVYRE